MYTEVGCAQGKHVLRGDAPTENEISLSLMVKFSIYATKIDETLVSTHQWLGGTALKNERGLNPPC